MASTPFLLSLSLLLLCSSASAFNVTTILERHGDFSTFNSLLTESGLAAEINSRKTITVLAVDNGAANALSGKPAEELKRVLSAHVVLDYYDSEKLGEMSNDAVTLPTLSSGVAVHRQSSGEFRVGSAAPGTGLTASVVKDVETHPNDISVLQVSGIIYPSTPTASTRRRAAAVPPGAGDEPVDDYDVEEAPTPGVGPTAALAPVVDEVTASPAPSSNLPNASSASRAALPLLGVLVSGFIYQITVV